MFRRPSADTDTVTESVFITMATPAEKALFASQRFQDCIRAHFGRVYGTTGLEPSAGSTHYREVRITGQRSLIEAVSKDLLRLISLSQTKDFTATTGKCTFVRRRSCHSHL